MGNCPFRDILVNYILVEVTLSSTDLVQLTAQDEIHLLNLPGGCYLSCYEEGQWPTYITSQLHLDGIC